MSRLSVTIIAWNEEERLRACLESVAWADEIVVVDAESADKTAQIAREFTDQRLGAPVAGLRGPEELRHRPGDRRLDPLPRRRRAGDPRAARPRPRDPQGRGRGRRLLDPATEHLLGGVGAPRRPLSRLPAPALPPGRRALRGARGPRVGHVSTARWSRCRAAAAPLAIATWRTSSRAPIATRPCPRRTGSAGAAGADSWGLVLGPSAASFPCTLFTRGFLDGWRGFVLAVLYAEYVFLRMAKVWETRRAGSPRG